MLKLQIYQMKFKYDERKRSQLESRIITRNLLFFVLLVMLTLTLPLLSLCMRVPIGKKRKVLWNDLKSALPYDPSPCLIMGDFNAILYPHEKKSNHYQSRKCNLFDSLYKSTKF